MVRAGVIQSRSAHGAAGRRPRSRTTHSARLVDSMRVFTTARLVVAQFVQCARFEKRLFGNGHPSLSDSCSAEEYLVVPLGRAKSASATVGRGATGSGAQCPIQLSYGRYLRQILSPPARMPSRPCRKLPVRTMNDAHCDHASMARAHTLRQRHSVQPLGFWRILGENIESSRLDRVLSTAYRRLE